MDCPDCLIAERDGGYGLIVRDDDSRHLVRINHCPWCGARLPEVADLGPEPFESYSS